jgi:rod shape determining protein RodA
MIEKRLERIDYFLVFSVFVVVSCGIFTLYSQEANFSDTTGRWYKQLMFFGIGTILMYLMTRINYQFLATYAIPIYILSIILLVLTLIPGIGYLPTGRGARSWLKIGPIAFQTSEFAKLSSVIILGQYLVLREKEIKSITVLLIPFVIVIIPMILILLQPDFGTAVSFIPMLLAMLFLGGADIMHIASLILLGSISLLIPMYLEYTKLTLLPEFISALGRADKRALLQEVIQLQGRVIPIIDGKKGVPEGMLELQKTDNFSFLKQLFSDVIEKNTSPLFQLLSNEYLMVIIGITLLSISFILILLKIARGTNQFRRAYITMGVIGISIIFSVIVDKTIPFRENQIIRLTAFINPDQFKQGAAYQLRASKSAVGSGQFFGKGFFNAEMTEGKIPHVPESGTDFIFSSWAEQTGFIGSAFLLFFLLAIPLKGLQISFESKDRFGSLLAAGIVALLFFHIAINIGIVLGVLPITGLPLSFMSYGGSHLITAMVSIGIIISIKVRKHAN